MIDIFQISKLLIKRKLKILTDSEKLELQDFNKKNSFIKEIKIKKLVDKIDSYSEIDTEKAWEILKAKYFDHLSLQLFLQRIPAISNMLSMLENSIPLTANSGSQLRAPSPVH